MSPGRPRGTPIAEERRRVLVEFVGDFDYRQGPDSLWLDAVLEDWVAGSPLVQVSSAQSG